MGGDLAQGCGCGLMCAGGVDSLGILSPQIRRRLSNVGYLG